MALKEKVLCITDCAILYLCTKHSQQKESKSKRFSNYYTILGNGRSPSLQAHTAAAAPHLLLSRSEEGAGAVEEEGCVRLLLAVPTVVPCVRHAVVPQNHQQGVILEPLDHRPAPQQAGLLQYCTVQEAHSNKTPSVLYSAGCSLKHDSYSTVQCREITQT